MPPLSDNPNHAALLADARQVIAVEAAGLMLAAQALGPAAAEAMVLIEQRTGPDLPGALVVSGVGKSGLLGQRISASFASTGTASHFLHPVEAVHGDLGRVRRNDITLLFSHSGETEELIRLADVLKRMDVPMVLITSDATSTLGKLATLCVATGDVREACPLQLAPTTSLAVAGAVGDALVLGVMSLRKFSRDDFAAFHPAGSLGRKLIKVRQAMGFRVPENLALVDAGATVRQALSVRTNGARRPGAIVLADADGRLAGIFTDGDLRRKIQEVVGLLDAPIASVMTANPKHIHADALASEAMAVMNAHRIDELPVVDDAGRPVGLVDVQDLLRLRMVD